MENLEFFIRDISMKNEDDDPIVKVFFRTISKNFRRITSNNILQLRLAEEAVAYSIGISMELIDPNSNFKKAVNYGLDKYIENEPLIREIENSTIDLVRTAVIRVAYYILSLKIALNDELITYEHTKKIDELFECIFDEYISWDMVASDTKLNKEDFLQKIKYVYRQIYKGLPSVYIPANLFMSLSLINLNQFENKEWRYFVKTENLEKCLKLLSSPRLHIEGKRLFDYIKKCMPEMLDNFTTNQMNRVISLRQDNKTLKNQYIQLKSTIETYTSLKSYTSSDELLSKINSLQNKVIEMTMDKVALESIINSQEKDRTSLQQKIDELLLTNYHLKQENEDQKKELERLKSQNSIIHEKPEPLSYYIKDPQLLKKTVDYAESNECTKKIFFYKYIYRNLFEHGISIETLRSTEFLRALIPHLKHLKGINSEELNRKDVLSLQQTIRINDAKRR